MHRLGAQELADRGPQHRPAVRLREYGVRPAPLSWSSHPPVRRRHFAERDRAPVAELVRPLAELVAAVARGVRPHARHLPVARQNLGRRSGAKRWSCEPELRAHGIRPRQQRRGRHRRRRHVRVTGAGHGARHVARRRIAGRPDERVGEVEGVEHGISELQEFQNFTTAPHCHRSHRSSPSHRSPDVRP